MLFRSKLFSRIFYFLGLIILIVTGGTVGYMMIEKWEFIDSFYMTIITISTVGFEEVGELSIYGKLFAAFLPLVRKFMPLILMRLFGKRNWTQPWLSGNFF